MAKKKPQLPQPSQPASSASSGPAGSSGYASSSVSTSTPSSASSTVSSASSTKSTVPHRSQYFLILILVSLNNTFDRKTLVLPFYPEVLKLGRQTSPKNAPAPDNGYFDSRVLSRSHAEVWADKDTGKVWIKDSKSSNGTYINSVRLGNEKSESEPHELKKNDILELGIDITNDERTTFVHRKISARVDRIAMMSLQATPESPYSVLVPNAPFGSNQSFPFQNGNGASGANGFGSGIHVIGNGNSSTLMRMGGGGNGLGGSGATPAESLDVTLFGEIDASLEDLSLNHSRNLVGGGFMSTGVTSTAIVEKIVKRLVNEIHHAKVESAKIRSVSKLLEQISSNQQESKTLTDRLPSLDVYKQQIEALTLDLEQAKTDIAQKDAVIADLEQRLLAASTSEPSDKDSEKLNQDDRALDEKRTDGDSLEESLEGSKAFVSEGAAASAGPTSAGLITTTTTSVTTTTNVQAVDPEQPRSPDLYADPIHQLSPSLDISNLNLNSPAFTKPAHTLAAGPPAIRAAGISTALGGDPMAMAVDIDGHPYNDVYVGDDEEDDDDQVSYPKENDATEVGRVPRRAASVPSLSPPHSPSHSFTEIRSLPQSPRSIFNARPVSPARPVVRSVSSSMNMLGSRGYPSKYKSSATPVTSSSLAAAATLSNGFIKSKTVVTVTEPLDDEVSTPKREDTDRIMKELAQQLAEARCQLEIYKNRAESAEKMAMESSKMIGELSLKEQSCSKSLTEKPQEHETPASHSSLEVKSPQPSSHKIVDHPHLRDVYNKYSHQVTAGAMVAAGISLYYVLKSFSSGDSH